MRIDRRHFIAGSLAGAVTGKAVVLAQTVARKELPRPTGGDSLATWADVRSQFLLGHDYVHMALMLFASHPRPVREAIERHRRGLDENPVLYLHEHFPLEAEVRVAAAEYVGGQPDEIALTGSTTTGLALLYGGLPLRPRQEILTTTHDHYVTSNGNLTRTERAPPRHATCWRRSRRSWPRGRPR